MIAVALIAGAAAIALSGGSLRGALVFAAFAIVPGAAMLTALRIDDTISWLGLSIALSLMTWSLVSSVALWLHVFNPFAFGAVVLGASTFVLIAHAATTARTQRWPIGIFLPNRSLPADRSARGMLVTLGLVLPLLLGLGLWAGALTTIDLSKMTDYGLPGVAPPTWFIGIGLIAVSGAVIASAAGSRGTVCALYVAALAVVIYATMPLLAEGPHFVWLYKHVGVVRLLDSLGHVQTSADIYNRWPGFFAAAASFGRFSGIPDPIHYAKWAELFFISVQLLLVSAIVRRFTRAAGVAALTCVVFLLTNWVGQVYFAPQSFAYTLGLAAILAALWQLNANGNGLSRWLLRMMTGVSRSPSQWAPITSGSWSKASAIAIVIGLDAAIVVSHQLTPYILLIQLGAMVLFGFIRPWWLIAAMTALTIAFLIPNVAFVDGNFGLFTSIDPFHNVQHSAVYDVAPMEGFRLSGAAGQLLSVTMWLSALIGAIVLARTGVAKVALMLGVFAFSPFALIFGQNYGGEAGLRIILFSAPFCAMLIALALFNFKRSLRAVAAGTLAALCTAFFLVAYFGDEEINVIPPTEVQASQYFYDKAEAGSVLMLAGPNFPNRVAARYPLIRGPKSDDDPNLLRTNFFRNRPLGDEDVADVISGLKQYSNTGYIVFSDSQYAFARIYRLTPPGELENLEAAIAGSERFRSFYSNPTTRIYKMQEPSK